MKKALLVFFTCLFSKFNTYSQELNCKVIVNTDKLQSSETFIFDDLQTGIEQFLNNQIWTEDNYESAERINCNFIINILNLNNNLSKQKQQYYERIFLTSK